METPTYIATNIDELFDKAPEDIHELLSGGEVDTVTITLSSNYKIPVGNQTALSNIISFILIGALQPEAQRAGPILGAPPSGR